jgi:GH43 family beta-xylosidase
VLPSPSQDPQLTWIDGKYYYCESSKKGIFLRVAADFLELDRAPQIRVYAPPRSGPAARNIWAPELHVIDGRCYIYFAADNGDNANHRMWVLATETADPLGPYELVGALDTEGWAIDGTTFCDAQGERYFVWSGWAGRTDGQQNLYISRMKNPAELCGGRVLLSTPNLYWERRGMPICEGPQVLRRGGKVFIVYSASASWTADYCLGMLVCDAGDVMDQENWRKVGKVFGSNEHDWGVGHCGFMTTPEGEDWILYHAKTLRRPGWEDREVRAQPYGWNHYGHPTFGEPFARNRPLLRTGVEWLRAG